MLRREQMRTARYVLTAIFLGRAPGEQPLTRRAVLTRLLAALVLAVALWVYIENETNPVQTQPPFTLQVLPLNLPTNVAIRGQLGQVTVTAQGLQSSLNSKTTLRAYVDLQDAPLSGEVVRPVLLRGGSPDVHYTISPSTATLFLEPQESISVPVVFNPESTLPGNLSLGGSVVTPGSVIIQGPKEQVDQVKDAYVGAPLAALQAPDTATAVFHQSFKLVPQLVDSQGRLLPNTNSLKITPQYVNVTLTINQNQVIKTLPIAPSFPCSAPTGLLVVPNAEPSTVTVAGPPQSLVGLKVLTTVEPACLPPHVTHTVRLRLHLLLPYGVTVVPSSQGRAPANVQQPPWTVVVSVIKEEISAALPAQVVLQQVGPRLRAAVQSPLITVYVTGAYVHIAAVKQLHAYVDLANRGPGSYNLTPTVDMPLTLPRYSISPATVHVVITAAPSG